MDSDHNRHMGLTDFDILLITKSIPTNLNPDDAVMSAALFGTRRIALTATEMYAPTDPRRCISFAHSGRGVVAFAVANDNGEVHQLVWLTRGFGPKLLHDPSGLKRLARRMEIPGRMPGILAPEAEFTDMLTNVASAMQDIDVMRDLLEAQGMWSDPLRLVTPLGVYAVPGFYRVRIAAAQAA